MSEQEFEQHLQRLLRADADHGVRPVDATVIARRAVSRRSSGKDRPSIVRSTRYLLAAALLIVGALTAFSFGSRMLVLPAPTSSPDATPTGAAHLPPSPTTPASTASASASVSPVASETASAAPTGASPSPSDTATPSVGPTATASLAITASPTASARSQPNWTSVAAGSGHACAITEGAVFCWGGNSMGELGDGTTADRWALTTAVAGIADAVDVSAGIRYSCAVRADGSVWCWGENLHDDGSTAVPAQVAGISDGKRIAAGGAHACALRSSGSVACWGMGQLGQLGNGTIVHNNGNATPVEVAGIDDALAITAGWNHTCALRSDRSVWCWGGNGDGATGYGQLGDGAWENVASPVQVAGLDDVIHVAAGGWTTCAARADGTVWCWGYGERGGLGDGQTTNSAVPVQVSGLSAAIEVAVGGWHACAISSGGGVACWGDNSWAGSWTLGDGTRVDPIPVEAPGMSDAVQLAAGTSSTLALARDGSLWGWGWYLDGLPVLVPGSGE